MSRTRLQPEELRYLNLHAVDMFDLEEIPDDTLMEYYQAIDQPTTQEASWL